jgi:hypothetical protein
MCSRRYVRKDAIMCSRVNNIGAQRCGDCAQGCGDMCSKSMICALNQ